VKRIAILIVAMTAAAQLVAGGAQQNRPGPPAPRTLPRFDPMNAVITGRVVTATSNSPMRAAQVRAHSDDGIDRLVTTNDDGRFQIGGLATGRWTLTVSKAGFLTRRFGQRRPFDPTTPIDLSSGQRFTADFVLPRGGAITGRVYDEFGEPVVGARVKALRLLMRDGRRTLQQVGPVDESDDTGAFRVYDLPAGTYFVSAARRIAPVDSPNEATFAPTYYPGTTSPQTAMRVSLAAGDEEAVSFPLMPVRTVFVTGSVLKADSTPASADLNLIAPASDSAVTTSAGAMTEPDGRFVIPNVAPGDYVLTAMVRNDAGLPERGSLPLTIGDESVAGITVYVSRGATLAATIVPDDGVTRPLPTGAAIRITARSVPPDLPNVTFTSIVPARPGQQPTALQAIMPGLFGRQALRLEGLPEPWVVKSIVVDSNADATDAPFDFRLDRNSARVVITDRITDVTGSVGGDAAADATVLVFPDDQEKLAFPSRYVRAVRVQRDGSFDIRALPPAERYFAIALAYVEDTEPQDPDFLNGLRDHTTSFSLREGETTNLRLTVVPR